MPGRIPRERILQIGREAFEEVGASYNQVYTHLKAGGEQSIQGRLIKWYDAEKPKQIAQHINKKMHATAYGRCYVAKVVENEKTGIKSVQVFKA